MHYDTTLNQAVAQLDNLVDEWRKLREGIDAADRLQVLALDALESEISSVIGSVRFKRGQAKDLAEQQADQDRQRRKEEQTEATRERLEDLTGSYLKQ